MVKTNESEYFRLTIAKHLLSSRSGPIGKHSMPRPMRCRVSAHGYDGRLIPGRCRQRKEIHSERRWRYYRRFPDRWIVLQTLTVIRENHNTFLFLLVAHGTTINSDAYVATLKKLQARLSRIRPHR
ncbi:hypothetical protein ANN_16813 [Periplaneta americana]|uniref:Uncharacterized protein n=1 Tax=Periplaneta americana TaxID=6978 RepID=A0ABQ8SSK9_PERAM|nr:hypothetical protein ANN_16813 [Periplaneta americana]